MPIVKRVIKTCKETSEKFQRLLAQKPLLCINNSFTNPFDTKRGRQHISQVSNIRQATEWGEGVLPEARFPTRTSNSGFRSMNTMLAAVISKSVTNVSHVVGLAFTNGIAISSGGIGMQSSAVHGRAVARNSCYCEAPTLRSNATMSCSLLSMANLRGDAP